jgi:N-acyl-phosphatidylethanolamine-hydrolysing phospholipase D
MGPMHVDPEQAVQIHVDVKSLKSIAIHWGTFALAQEYYMEPKQKLREALEKFSLDPKIFTTLKHGEINEI